jgi:hypothetical protein
MRKCLMNYVGLGTACWHEVSFKVSKAGKLVTPQIFMC